jgi:hypothetical protein
MYRLFFGVIAFSLVAQSLALAATAADVQSKYMRCEEAEAKDLLEKCVLAQPNVRPVEEFTKSGQRVLRAFLFDGEGRPRLFLQFAEKGGEVTLEVRGPFSEQAIVEREISPHAWSGFLDKWVNFDDALKLRSDERKRHEEELAKSGQEEVCIHAWSAIVESNIQNMPQIMEPEACDDQPGRFDLINDMLVTAMQFAPECSALKPEYFGYNAQRFNRCGDLHGDRLQAAAVLNRAWLFNTVDAPKISDADLAQLISPDGMLSFGGGEVSRGSLRVVKAWRDAVRFTSDLSFDISDVTASENVVTVHGTMYSLKTTHVPYVEYWAPFTQHWREGDDGTQLLTDWEVGKFVEEKDR